MHGGRYTSNCTAGSLFDIGMHVCALSCCGVMTVMYLHTYDVLQVVGQLSRLAVAPEGTTVVGSAVVKEVCVWDVWDMANSVLVCASV